MPAWMVGWLAAACRSSDDGGEKAHGLRGPLATVTRRVPKQAQPRVTLDKNETLFPEVRLSV
jgi:hypothetical protein